MPAVAGNQAKLWFAFQSGQGTPAATPVYGLYLAGGEQVEPVIEEADFEETTGLRMRSDRYRGQVRAEGTPEFFVTPKAIAALLYAVLGSKAVSGAGDPYSHVLTPAATLPWLTVWRSLGGLIFERFVDCKVPQLVLSGESFAPLRVVPTIVGLKPQNKTADQAVAIETTNRFMHYNGAGALLVEGVAAATMRSFELTINNNAEAVPGDALTPVDIAEQLLEVTLGATMLFQGPKATSTTTAAIRNRLLYGSGEPADNADVVNTVLEAAGSPPIDMKFTRATGPERSLRYQIARVAVDPFEVQPNTDGARLEAEMMFRALQPAAGAAITATVLNDQATIG